MTLRYNISESIGEGRSSYRVISALKSFMYVDGTYVSTFSKQNQVLYVYQTDEKSLHSRTMVRILPRGEIYKHCEAVWLTREYCGCGISLYRI